MDNKIIAVIAGVAIAGSVAGYSIGDLTTDTKAVVSEPQVVENVDYSAIQSSVSVEHTCGASSLPLQVGTGMICSTPEQYEQVKVNLLADLNTEKCRGETQDETKKDCEIGSEGCKKICWDFDMNNFSPLIFTVNNELKDSVAVMDLDKQAVADLLSNKTK